ncbi:hypothetical protein N7517_008217 [Penicillium concentricum]|uniref:Uncharacterized protein n=1 Tax=Penicillium concentricum TaxID=293559 RepID=A0A9W9RSB1_9EURO|nr:uncharacterized protein N7517_008217 [Penicillium concentricum]KAJ5365331.1 hypothetical protein N7517_008217 [Penicillium concentricum]
MGTLLRDPFINPFEEERQKYSGDHHEPTTHQLNRFSIYCELLRQDPELLNDKKSSTRSRKKIARENLLKISRLSSSIFALCCFLVATTELGSKSYLEIIPKLRDWWGSVKHPKALADRARVLCEIEGVEYVETVNTSEDHEIQAKEPPTNSSEGSIFLYRDEIPMLQVSLLPSEPPYQAIDLSTSHLVNFLLTYESLSNRQAVVSLLQQYEPSCPILKLKMPFSNAFPSVEMKVTSDFGSSVCLLFAWELANDLVISLGYSTTNIAN